MLTHVTAAVVLVAVVLTSTLWVAHQHNQLAQKNTLHIVTGSVEGFRDQLSTMTLDYAFWDAAYDALRTNDTEWFYPNVGSGVGEGNALELASFFSGDLSRNFGWIYSQESDALRDGLLTADMVKQLNALLDGIQLGTKEAPTTFVKIANELWVVGVSRVEPWDGLPTGVTDEMVFRQVLGHRVTNDFLAEIAASFNLAGLQLVADQPEATAYHALQGADGTTLGYLAWEQPKPGNVVLKQVGLPLALMVILVLLALGSSFYNTLRNAQQLEAALVRANASNKSKDEFIATVSHELRTPLTSIKGSLDLLHSGSVAELSNTAMKLVSMAAKNAGTLMHLVNSLLDFESLATGKLKLEKKKTEILPVVEQAVNVARELHPNREINLRSDIQSACFAKIDQERIAQVLSNLLSNAVKFSPADTSVDVDVYVGKRFVTIAVNDNGPGIPQQDQSKIFERFTQGDSSDTRHHGGTGLGLTIAKEIAECHGGKIDLISACGQGSTFFLELPTS